LSTTPLLWAVVTIKLVVLAAVCIAVPLQGSALLVTNLLLACFSRRRNRGYMFTVMLMVNVVLWLLAGLSCPWTTGRTCVLFAFLMTIAIWLPVPALTSGKSGCSAIGRR